MKQKIKNVHITENRKINIPIIKALLNITFRIYSLHLKLFLSFSLLHFMNTFNQERLSFRLRADFSEAVINLYFADLQEH